MLDDVHGKSHLVMVVGQLAHLLDGHGAACHLALEVNLEVLCDGGHQEAGQGEGRLAQHVAYEGLSDVAADG